MRPLHIIAVLLAALVAFGGRDHGSVQNATGEAYLSELARLVTELQKNPWTGWPAGTRVVVRQVDEDISAKGTRSRERPDTVFTVVEADRSFQVTQLFKGNTFEHDFLIKNQPGLDTAGTAPLSSLDQRPTPTSISIDGVSVSCLTRESSVTERYTEVGKREMRTGTTVVREWTMASHPSAVLRKETVDGGGWEVTSARTRRSIGEKEFQCLEVRSWLRFYHDGPNDSITTRHLCPGVPGHVAEERKEFYKVVKGQRSATPYQVHHQKTVELSVPEASF